MRKSILSATLLLVLLGTACAQAGGELRTPPKAAPGQAPADDRATEAQRRAGGPAVASSGGSSFAEASIPRLDRMVIANVNLSVSVDNAVQAARAAERVAERYGGFVGNSNVRDVDGVREATVTLRVPSHSLPDALAELRDIGRKVTDESRTTQDVTEEFTDVESSLRNLRATEAQLLAFMERATKMEDILALQRELTNLRGQIERLEGRRRVLENRADLATVAMRLLEPPSVTPRDGWAPQETFAEALAALARLGQGAGTVAIWLAVFSPIYAIPLLIVWWLSRGRVGRAPVNA